MPVARISAAMCRLLVGRVNQETEPLVDLGRIRAVPAARHAVDVRRLRARRTGPAAAAQPRVLNLRLSGRTRNRDDGGACCQISL